MASKLVSSLLALVSRTSDPTTAPAGSIFFRSDTKKWRGHTGTGFVDINGDPQVYISNTPISTNQVYIRVQVDGNGDPQAIYLGVPSG